MKPDEKFNVISRFNSFINSRNIDGLNDLMTDDHTFIDSANTRIIGKENCLSAWKEFFVLFPDYKNEFKSITNRNDEVIIMGYSICSDKRLEGPAIWKAKISEGKISEWRVYEDTPKVRTELKVSI